jgi:hypothetical protein
LKGVGAVEAKGSDADEAFVGVRSGSGHGVFDIQGGRWGWSRGVRQDVWGIINGRIGRIVNSRQDLHTWEGMNPSPCVFPSWGMKRSQLSQVGRFPSTPFHPSRFSVLVLVHVVLDFVYLTETSLWGVFLTGNHLPIALIVVNTMIQLVWNELLAPPSNKNM